MSAKASRHLRTQLIVVLVLAALYVAYRYTLHRMVEAKLDEIRQQGYPTTFRELDKEYPFPPAAENAAGVYTQAFAYLRERSVHNTNLPIVGDAPSPRRSEPLPNEMKAAIEDYLSSRADPLALLHKAAAYQKCRYKLGLDDERDSLRVATTIFGPLRQSARLLLLESMLRTEEQAKDPAVESLICSLKLSQSLEVPPLLLSALVRNACDELTDYGLQRLLSRCPLEEPQLQLLSKSLLEHLTTDAPGKFAASESCLGIAMFAALRSENMFRRGSFGEHLATGMAFGDEKPPYYGVRFILYRLTDSLELDELAYLRVEDDYRQVCRLSLPQRLQEIDMLEQRLDSFPKRYPYTRQFIFGWNKKPSLGIPLRNDAVLIARLRNAVVACAVERYRLHNTSLPQTLDELVPKYLADLPSDPFDGQPLRYKKLSKGYVVYSVGEDGKDDGGDEKKDITFTVER